MKQIFNQIPTWGRSNVTFFIFGLLPTNLLIASSEEAPIRLLCSFSHLRLFLTRCWTFSVARVVCVHEAVVDWAHFHRHILDFFLKPVKIPWCSSSQGRVQNVPRVRWKREQKGTDILWQGSAADASSWATKAWGFWLCGGSLTQLMVSSSLLRGLRYYKRETQSKNSLLI